MSDSRRILALAAFPALAGLVSAAETPADFPANSAEPQTEVAPARGIPQYDGDTESVKRDMVSPPPGAEEEENPAKKFETPRTKALREGDTQAEAGGLAEWRVPVSMRKGASGRMGEWTSGATASVRHISENFAGILNFEYRRTDFDFEGASPAPWGDTDAYRLFGHIETTVSGGWGVFANGGVRLAAEKDASLGDGLTGHVALGARYRFIPEFTYYFGVLTATRLDNDPLIFPLTSFEFRMGKWSVLTVNGVVLAYDVFGDDSLVLGASTLFDTSDFRLSPEAGTGRKRSVQFQEVPLTFSVTKHLGAHAFVKLYTTAILWSDYRFRTDGETSGDFETSPGLAFGISAGARF